MMRNPRQAAAPLMQPKHLLANIDAQVQEGVAQVAQYAQHGQRDVRVGSWQCPQRGFRAKLQLRGSLAKHLDGLIQAKRIATFCSHVQQTSGHRR